MNNKRILALILALVMILPAMVSCDSKGDDNGPVEPGILTKSDSIVPGDLTFEGETFTVLCREDNAWSDVQHEISADEGETELVNQAVYDRNLEVEERFGLEALVAHAIPGQWAVGDDFVNTFKNSILSDSGAFDLIMSHQAYMVSDPENIELYYNLYELPYVKDNLGATFYNQDIVKEMTINGKLFFLLSDYSLTYWESAYVLYFNKALAENNNLEDLYALVKDGTWTFDRMTEMAKGKWQDLNGDLWPDESDSFGYVSDIPNTTDALSSHFDTHLTGRDENGEVVFNVDQGKMVNILEAFIEFKNSDDTHFVQTSSSDTNDSNPVDKIFREGRALFYPAQLDRAQEFRGMETDFGIIPYPKWDDNQDNYYTHAQDGYSIGVVPMDVRNPEKVGAVVDVLCALSSEMVIPAYYDMALKDKYSRDDESGKMLDIIREGFTCNFGYFYGQPLGCANIFRQLIAQDNSNFVSYYAVQSKGYNRKLNQLIACYEDDAE